MLLFLLPLLALVHSSFGISSQPIYLSPSILPALPSFVGKKFPEHVTAASLSASFAPFIAVRRHHFRHQAAAPASSHLSHGPRASPAGTLLRHHHHRHGAKSRAISPSPSTSPGCGQTCAEPLASAPFGSPCACVFPMKVRLLLSVSLYAIFPEVTELEIEVAAGTYLKQSQVTIIGASADSQNQERTVVDINLVPLGEKFDNTTAILTYQRFLHKKVPLNRTLFGDYDVLYVAYPGLLSSSGILSGEGPTGSVGNQQYPISADFASKNQKMSPAIIFVIGLSVFVF